MITLKNIIDEHLKTSKDHTEIMLLKKFKEYIGSNTRIKEVELEDFDPFLDSLSVSETTRKSYAVKLRRFQKVIGLFQVTVKKNRNPLNAQEVILELKKNLAKTEKEREEEKRAKEAHSQTIDEMNKKEQNRCSKCAEILKLKTTMESNNATFDKKTAKYEGLQYMIDSGEIEDIKQLQAKKTHLEEEITKANKIMENQQLVKVLCPATGSIVSFGNDCMHCSDFISCSKYGELTNPRA